MRRPLGRGAARVAPLLVALVATTALFTTRAEASAIVPVAVERTFLSIVYFGEQIASTFGVSEPNLNPIAPPHWLASTIGSTEVTGALFAVGFEDAYSNGNEEGVQRTDFRLDFDVAAPTDYVLDATLSLRQQPPGGILSEVLGDSGVALSHFDSSLGIFVPIHTASGSRCLGSAPCDATGSADASGGYSFTVIETGQLAPGRYRLEAHAEAWGYPFAFDSDDFFDEGVGGFAQSNFVFGVVPEPTTRSAIGVGLATLLLARRSRAGGRLR